MALIGAFPCLGSRNQPLSLSEADGTLPPIIPIIRGA